QAVDGEDGAAVAPGGDVSGHHVQQPHATREPSRSAKRRAYAGQVADSAARRHSGLMARTASGWRTHQTMRPVRASTSSTGTIQPVRPSVTRSFAPTISEISTGSPEARASGTTMA